MKKILLIGAVAILLLAGVIAAYCTYQTDNSEVTVVVDITDSLPATMHIDAEAILAQSGLSKNKWEKVLVRVMAITEYDYNEIRVLTLPDRFLLFSNPIDRDTEIDAFNKQLSATINSVVKEQTKKQRSNIYVSLVHELNKLATSKAKHKALILYSDLCENTPLFTIYGCSNYLKLKEHPDAVRKILFSAARPNDLHGVSIFFTYKPESIRSNDAFTLMYNLFKDIFFEAGADVHVGANLVTENE